MKWFVFLKNALGIRLLVCLLVGGTAFPVWGHQVNSGNKLKLRPYEGIGGDFELTNQNKEKVRLQDFRGKMVLLNFGYTSCPDVCPLVLSHLKKLVENLDEHAGQFQTIFITFDPERDTPEVLKNYLAHFHPSFIGLTGTKEDILKIAKQYGGMFIRQDVDSSAGYLFAHTDYVYLIDQKGKIRALYRSDDPIEKLENDIHQLLQ